MQRQYVIRAGLVRKLKEGVDINDYFAKHPDAYKVCKPPTMEEMEEWVSDGVAEAVDGCRVEPDGTCQHGKPSWLLALNYI